MLRISSLVILILLSGFFKDAFCQVEKEYVYKVKVKSQESNRYIVQTGFEIEGEAGIVTALHGVLSGKREAITATNAAGQTIVGLFVKSVDIERDVALLSTTKHSFLKQSGFARYAGSLNSLQLTVWGVPRQITLTKLPFSLLADPVKKLIDIVPPDLARTFNERKSPSLSIDVLLLVGGDLSPGHSGAPLLTGSNQVVGMAFGGLRDGGINWAIPVTSNNWVSWKDASLVTNELDALGKSNIHPSLTASGCLSCERHSYLMHSLIPGKIQYNAGKNFRGTAFISLITGSIVTAAIANRRANKFDNIALTKSGSLNQNYYFQKSDNWAQARNNLLISAGLFYIINIIDGISVFSRREKKDNFYYSP